MAGEHPSGLPSLPVDRSTYQYRPRRSEQAGLRKRIKEIAETRVRYGYRRIHVLLRREGWAVNAKRVCRLYREMGLQLRNKTPKRRVKAKLRSDHTTASSANDIWAMDFVHDKLFDGTKIRALTIVDTLAHLSASVGAIVEEMSSRRLKTARQSLAIPRRSASTMAPSASARSSICGAYIKGVTLDFSTSAGQASRPTTRSSNPSTASSGSNA
jgi:putative transposase